MAKLTEEQRFRELAELARELLVMYQDAEEYVIADNDCEFDELYAEIDRIGRRIDYLESGAV